MLNLPEYVGPGGASYVQPNKRGWTSVPVLQFLSGRKLDEVAFGYIHSVRPSR
jgi:hypothetical protein